MPDCGFQGTVFSVVSGPYEERWTGFPSREARGRGEVVSAEATMTTEVAEQKRRSDGFLNCEGGGRMSCIAGGGAAGGKRLKTGCCGGALAAAGRGSISVKEKKDKIGEKVAALQQLVSPYGKTDTASVLQEATGYIKFLHEQLQVLSAPYLRSTPTGKPQWRAPSQLPVAMVPISGPPSTQTGPNQATHASAPSRHQAPNNGGSLERECGILVSRRVIPDSFKRQQQVLAGGSTERLQAQLYGIEDRSSMGSHSF